MLLKLELWGAGYRLMQNLVTATIPISERNENPISDKIH